MALATVLGGTGHSVDMAPLEPDVVMEPSDGLDHVVDTVQNLVMKTYSFPACETPNTSVVPGFVTLDADNDGNAPVHVAEPALVPTTERVIGKMIRDAEAKVSQSGTHKQGLNLAAPPFVPCDAAPPFVTSAQQVVPVTPLYWECQVQDLVDSVKRIEVTMGLLFDSQRQSLQFMRSHFSGKLAARPIVPESSLLSSPITQLDQSFIRDSAVATSFPACETPNTSAVPGSVTLDADIDDTCASVENGQPSICVGSSVEVWSSSSNDFLPGIVHAILGDSATIHYSLKSGKEMVKDLRLNDPLMRIPMDTSSIAVHIEENPESEVDSQFEPDVPVDD